MRKQTQTQTLNPTAEIKATNGVTVKCWVQNPVLVPLADFKPNPRNSNMHPEKQVALLVKILAVQGVRHPIKVSRRSGFITSGHLRLLAAKALGMESFPADVQDYPDDASEAADLVADNQLSRMAETDWTVLRDVIEELDTGSFDLELTGFDAAGLERVMASIAADPAIGDKQVTDDDLAKAQRRLDESTERTDGKQAMAVTCPHCGKDFSVQA